MNNLSNPDNSLPAVALRTIFEFLDHRSLKNCRFVSPSWKEEATDYLKKKSICIPQLYSKKDDINQELSPIERYHTFFQDNVNIEKLSTSIQITEAFYNETNDNYDMVYLPLQFVNYELVDTWLEKNGNTIKGVRLKLAKDKVSQYLKTWTDLCGSLEEVEIRASGTLWEYSSPTSNPFLSHCPNISKLILSDKWDDDPSRGFFFHTSRVRQQNFQFVEQLFQALPNVKTVIASITEASFSLAVAQALQKYGKSVKHLIWRVVLYESSLNEFTRKSVMQLTTLHLDCSLFPFSSFPTKLQTFLEKHSKTLKVLKFKGVVVERWNDENRYGYDESDEEDDQREEYLPYVRLRVPRLENLKVLEIQNIFHLRIPENLFQFLSQFPNLRKLAITNVAYASDVRPQRPDEVLLLLLRPINSNDLLDQTHLKLEELTVDGEIVDSGVVINIANGFPNLKTLSLNIGSDGSDTAFKELFSKALPCLKGLQKLKLTIRLVLDMAWCASILTISLPQLNELTHLSLEFVSSEYLKQPFQLTEQTIVNGFCSAPKLKWLELINFSFSVIERDAIVRLLKERMACVKYSKCFLYSPPFDAFYSPYEESCVPKFLQI